MSLEANIKSGIPIDPEMRSFISKKYCIRSESTLKSECAIDNPAMRLVGRNIGNSLDSTLLDRRQKLHSNMDILANSIKEGSYINLEQYIRSDLPANLQAMADNVDLLDTHSWKISLFKKWFNINNNDLFVSSYIGAPIKIGNVDNYDMFEPTSFICVQNPQELGDLSVFHTLAIHKIGSDQRP